MNLKKQFSIFSLIFLLVSCQGKQEGSGSSDNEVEKDRYSKESEYDLPVIGFSNSLKLNYRYDFNYEGNTISKDPNSTVLGNYPFYVALNDLDKAEVHFYSDHDLRNVRYINKKSIPAGKFKDLNMGDINRFAHNIEDYTREFTYGYEFTQYPELKLEERIFIFDTYEADLPLVSKSTIMIWMEKDLKDKDVFRFHYKLLDYELTEEE